MTDSAGIVAAVIIAAIGWGNGVVFERMRQTNRIKRARLWVQGRVAADPMYKVGFCDGAVSVATGKIHEGGKEVLNTKVPEE